MCVDVWCWHGDRVCCVVGSICCVGVDVCVCVDDVGCYGVGVRVCCGVEYITGVCICADGGVDARVDARGCVGGGVGVGVCSCVCVYISDGVIGYVGMCIAICQRASVVVYVDVVVDVMRVLPYMPVMMLMLELGVVTNYDVGGYAGYCVWSVDYAGVCVDDSVDVCVFSYCRCN